MTLSKLQHGNEGGDADRAAHIHNKWVFVFMYDSIPYLVFAYVFNREELYTRCHHQPFLALEMLPNKTALLIR